MEDTEYFDIVAGVLQGGHAGPVPLYHFVLDYVLRKHRLTKSKENRFELTKKRKEKKKKRSRRYPANKQLPTPTTPMT